MYRKSSKGNPYHDAKGRFTSADGKLTPFASKDKDNPFGVKINAPIEQWSSFGEVHTADSVLSGDEKNEKEIKEKWTDKDAKVTKVAVSDGRRHYHNQSISREEYAKSISSLTFPKGLTLEERKVLRDKHRKAFEKENAVAIKNGGKVIPFVSGNTIKYQIVESNRMADDIQKHRTMTRNTSTSMKQFSGYTVEFYSDNVVRSLKANATLKDAQAGLKKYCSKHKKSLADAESCIKIWRDKTGRVRFMPTFKFKNKAEADEFAKSHKGATVVNHDDGSMA